MIIKLKKSTLKQHLIYKKDDTHYNNNSNKLKETKQMKTNT